jgi:hypothetical protein
MNRRRPLPGTGEVLRKQRGNNEELYQQHRRGKVKGPLDESHTGFL